MAQFGAHAFIWENDWTPETARRVIEGAARCGLDFVEIPLLRPESFDPEETRAMLDDHGLGARCSLGLPPQATLPDHPEKAQRFLEDAIEKVRRVGSPALSGVIYGTLGMLPGHPPRPGDMDIIADALRPVARFAAERGVALGIEPVNRYETHLVNLTDQGLDLIERIGDDNVFLHLDTYHMNIEEKGMREPIRRAGRHLRYIHLSESDRGTPGTGNVHWDDVFDGLADIGYEGDLVLESFVAVNEDIARATCIWRKVAPDPDTMIREGLGFLKEKAKARQLIAA